MDRRKTGDKIDWVTVSIYGAAFLGSVGAAAAILYWFTTKSKLEPGVYTNYFCTDKLFMQCSLEYFYR